MLAKRILICSEIRGLETALKSALKHEILCEEVSRLNLLSMNIPAESGTILLADNALLGPVLKSPNLHFSFGQGKNNVLKKWSIF